MELLTLYAEESTGSFCCSTRGRTGQQERSCRRIEQRDPKEIAWRAAPCSRESLAGKDRCSNICQTEALKRGKREAHSQVPKVKADGPWSRNCDNQDK